MAEMKQVLSRLAERTEQKLVPWRKDDLSDTYRASLRNLTFRITGATTGTKGSVYLHITDARGEKIGSAFYAPGESDVNSELVSIFEVATEMASDDPRLDEVLDALDAVSLAL